MWKTYSSKSAAWVRPVFKIQKSGENEKRFARFLRRKRNQGPIDEKVAEGVVEMFERILLDAHASGAASFDSGVSTRSVRRVRRNIERLHLRRGRVVGVGKTRGWPRLADSARSQLSLTEATLGQVSQVNRPGSVRVARETSAAESGSFNRFGHGCARNQADAATEGPWRQSFNVFGRNRAVLTRRTMPFFREIRRWKRN